jgi:hypothetical protein
MVYIGCESNEELLECKTYSYFLDFLEDSQINHATGWPIISQNERSALRDVGIKGGILGFYKVTDGGKKQVLDNLHKISESVENVELIIRDDAPSPIITYTDTKSLLESFQFLEKLIDDHNDRYKAWKKYEPPA